MSKFWAWTIIVGMWFATVIVLYVAYKWIGYPYWVYLTSAGVTGFIFGWNIDNIGRWLRGGKELYGPGS